MVDHEYPLDPPLFKHDLRESQVEPNMVTHSALLSACEKAGQWQLALKHWLEMRNAGEHIWLVVTGT